MLFIVDEGDAIEEMVLEENEGTEIEVKALEVANNVELALWSV